MEVRCNVDLYDGDVKAGKWYTVKESAGCLFVFDDEFGQPIFCLTENCPHLEYHPGAFWEFRNVEE